MTRLKNKVAIVTGAGSGMGLEEALLLAKEGAKVVLTDINEQAVLTAAESIQKAGGTAIALKHNVASEEDWIYVVSETITRFGKIDVLVNNAGISLPVAMLETTVEQWQRTIDINLTGTFLGMKHTIPQMQNNGSGSIINISSIAGLTGSSGAGAYTASKGGVRMLSKAAAVDFGPQNIRVNSIYPGYITTPMSEHLFQDDQMLQWFLSKTALPRVGEAPEVAQAVLFLASDDSSYITGVDLPVDGGVTAK
ncbi:MULTISPECIES: SDR family NAD(P)-dependent oxidoreductase [unclassified Paenibacillus]|uniref:SDR family NAD(P)-dependent oxidoreductase n=1 Tax=unclassified Paenibacillus TaxID=185978 RepID=UPI0009A6C3F5|nr:MULTISPECIES: glucose 1-dehydrogenase [unclassified Paenibacillus]SLK20819.1 NAD(P)-dependent dehydrogenase, short-chain alcohol dehydrogenase family [Paenibacillus sp. RU5A]SOC76318.1 NAD(P)-dependent dehydrogenase, short-chain alcohol dehydrogenase family [Paenibacillus sp. RU26A]SOC77960.1 NAD(P)-dependent dehydrogenase, short-chain alcohol dehydrogenase family [Paenibacillus sp. RU5M]